MTTSRRSAGSVGTVLFDYVLLVVSATLLAVCTVALWWSSLRSAYDGVDNNDLILALAGLGWFIVLGFARWWTKRRGASLRGARVVVVAGVVGTIVYLTHDEAPSPSIQRNRAVIEAGFQDEATWLLTLRYSTPKPGAGMEFKAPAHVLKFDYDGPKRDAKTVAAPDWSKRREYLVAHRVDIEANWAELAEVRAWWDELAAQSRLGDRILKGFEDPISRFQPIRAYTQHAVAVAGLAALDGKADEALAQVGKVYEVGAKLAPASCTLVRGMVAVVIQKQALEAASFILDTAKPSVEARERFAELLDNTVGGPEGARRLVLCEAPLWTAEKVSQIGLEQLQPTKGVRKQVRAALTPLRAIMVNPQASANRINDYLEILSRYAAARELDTMASEARRFEEELFAVFSVKNIAGRLLAGMVVPAFDKTVKSYWELEDRRAALAKRLRAGE